MRNFLLRPFRNQRFAVRNLFSCASVFRHFVAVEGGDRMSRMNKMQKLIVLIAGWLSINAAVAQIADVEKILIASLYPDGYGLYDAYVFGSAGIGIVGGNGTILWSSDQFQTWFRQKVAPDEYRSIFSIEMINSVVGVVVGEGGLCYRTISRGNTWSQVELPVQRTLYRVRKVPQNGVSIVAVGAGGTILKSTTQGFDWKKRQSGTQKDLYGLAFRRNVAVAVGAGGVILRSTDEGWGWTVVREQDMEGRSLYDVTAVTDSLWIAVGAGLVIVRSTDGGKTWHTSRLRAPKDDVERLRGIWFENDTLGWIVGRRSGFRDGIWRTTDGGKTWELAGIRTYRGESSQATDWWGIRRVQGKLLIWGERRKYSIVAVESDPPDTLWRAAVWDPRVAYARLRSGRVSDCRQLELLVGHSVSPHIAICDLQEQRWKKVLPIPLVEEDSSGKKIGAEYAVWRGSSIVAYKKNDPWIWRSDDSGRTWQVASLGDTLRIVRIFPMGPMQLGLTGRVYDTTTLPYRSYSLLMVSTDRGATWQRRFAFPQSEADARLGVVSFADATTGWIVVDRQQTGKVELWRTTDGGGSWQRWDVRDVFQPEDEQWRLVGILAMQAYDAERVECVVWAMVYQDGVYQKQILQLVRSTDGGNTWEREWTNEDWGLDAGFSGANIASDGWEHRGILLQGDFGGVVIYTHNGGKQWRLWNLPREGGFPRLIGFSARCMIITRNAPGIIESPYPRPAHVLYVTFFSVTDVAEEWENEGSGEAFGVRVQMDRASQMLVLRYAPEVRGAVKQVALYSLKGKQVVRYDRAVENVPLRGISRGMYYVVISLSQGRFAIAPVAVP